MHNTLRLIFLSSRRIKKASGKLSQADGWFHSKMQGGWSTANLSIFLSCAAWTFRNLSDARLPMAWQCCAWIQLPHRLHVDEWVSLLGAAVFRAIAMFCISRVIWLRPCNLKRDNHWASTAETNGHNLSHSFSLDRRLNIHFSNQRFWELSFPVKFC